MYMMKRKIFMVYCTNHMRVDGLLAECITSAFAPNGPYILVVDDDQAILSVIMMLLETEGYAAVGFTESKRVLPFLEQAQRDGTMCLPSVILLDLMMPAISGYEIAARLSRHERYIHIPIIIMTADDKIRGASAVRGATDWLSKPFHIDRLLDKLECYLSPALAL